jgi:hypothetical protein
MPSLATGLACAGAIWMNIARKTSTSMMELFKFTFSPFSGNEQTPSALEGVCSFGVEMESCLRQSHGRGKKKFT